LTPREQLINFASPPMKFIPLTLTRLWAPEQMPGTFPTSWALARRIAFPLLFLGVGLVLVQPCEGGSGVFESTGSLGSARYGHTATLLPSGKVLVAGGYNVLEGNAELYDPASGTWTFTGSLALFARDSHTATLLPNGKVLVAGGYGCCGSGQLSSAELYDPVSGTWTSTGSLSSAREGPTGTLLPNGKVLVAGGYGCCGPIASAELYDPVSGTWTATGSLATARDGHTATLLPTGKVLVAAGSGLASAELYDPASQTWAATGSLITSRYEHTMTLLPDGKVLVTGGFNGFSFDLASAELYDPLSGTWAATGSLATARDGHTATLLPNGKVLVAAGGTHFSNIFRSAELYVGQPTPPALLNSSTRMRVLADDKVLIGGFIVSGTDQKRVIIRGMGPSLNGVGVTLSDPTLELHQGGTTLATNDNWRTRPDGSSQQAEIEATTIPPTNELESAILVTLSPGAYTAILAGKNGGTGVGLVEVYDLGQGANSKLANVSTRGFVDTGDNVMIGGFIVGGGSGGGTARVMVRALGPSVPVAGALGDPTLELHDGSGTTIATNDNWKTRPDGSSQQAEIEATTIPPTNDLESALVRTLPPDNYTAIVRGKNSTTGVGLVEIYNLQ
jgi:Galactose oxidase, central domain/Kelch motif